MPGIRAAAVAIASALLLGVAACGAGQDAQTARTESIVNGAHGRVGEILLRDAVIVFDPPVEGGAVYEPGQTAPLRFTVVNDADRPDRLVSVSSPVAESG